MSSNDPRPRRSSITRSATAPTDWGSGTAGDRSCSGRRSVTRTALTRPRSDCLMQGAEGVVSGTPPTWLAVPLDRCFNVCGHYGWMDGFIYFLQNGYAYHRSATCLISYVLHSEKKLTFGDSLGTDRDTQVSDLVNPPIPSRPAPTAAKYTRSDRNRPHRTATNSKVCTSLARLTGPRR